MSLKLTFSSMYLFRFNHNFMYYSIVILPNLKANLYMLEKLNVSSGLKLSKPGAILDKLNELIVWMRMKNLSKVQNYVKNTVPESKSIIIKFKNWLKNLAKSILILKADRNLISSEGKIHKFTNTWWNLINDSFFHMLTLQLLWFLSIGFVYIAFFTVICWLDQLAKSDSLNN